ncbi:MAG: hypothetical protein MUE40_10775 [Anaerolineae bacterium]|nr:hypothetical protein [Anaerolineae bacterium]
MMSNAQNYHIQYPGVTNQHWHAGSGRYAGGDHLLTALTDGWMLHRCVQVTHTYAGMRFVTVYQFELERGGEAMTMPVITNPYIERFLQTSGIQVVDGAQNKEEAA